MCVCVFLYVRECGVIPGVGTVCESEIMVLCRVCVCACALVWLCVLSSVLVMSVCVCPAVSIHMHMCKELQVDSSIIDMPANDRCILFSPFSNTNVRLSLFFFYEVGSLPFYLFIFHFFGVTLILRAYKSVHM